MQKAPGDSALSSGAFSVQAAPWLLKETTRAGDYETKGETLHTDGEEGSQ